MPSTLWTHCIIEQLKTYNIRFLSYVPDSVIEQILKLARQEFGRFAPVVFGEWGIASGEDVGRIVFQLVESRQLSARREDSIDDFRGGGELFAALTANLDFGPRPADERMSREPGTKG